MNISFARTFLEVVKAGNLNRAAANLNVTESTVTTRINSLENLLGQKLLIRSRTGAELTSSGFQFLRYAEVISQAWEQAQQDLTLSTDFASVCNVGCQFDLWHQTGKSWADNMRANHPDVAMSFWAGSVEDIEKWLANGLVDVALMFDATVSGNWHVQKIGADRLILVSTQPCRSVEADAGYFYVDLGRDFRRFHAEAFSVTRTPVVTISASAWAIDYLLTWGGSAYLPHRMVSHLIEADQVFQVADAPVFSRDAYIVSRADVTEKWDWFDQAVETLRAALEAASPNLGKE